MSCAICEKRPPKRYCPAKGEKICAICCGREREVTIDCPSDCPHLTAAHRYEAEHRKPRTLAGRRRPCSGNSQFPSPAQRSQRQRSLRRDRSAGRNTPHPRNWNLLRAAARCSARARSLRANRWVPAGVQAKRYRTRGHCSAKGCGRFPSARLSAAGRQAGNQWPFPLARVSRLPPRAIPSSGRGRKRRSPHYHSLTITRPLTFP